MLKKLALTDQHINKYFLQNILKVIDDMERWLSGKKDTFVLIKKHEKAIIKST